jgi:hypothetical protein
LEAEALEYARYFENRFRLGEKPVVIARLKNSFPVKLTGIHFFLVFACAFFSFRNLTHWDAEWYRQIVEVGYSSVHSADPNVEGRGNVGFFPGYPLACYLVKKILGLGSDAFPTTGALLIVSNGFAILTWVFLEKWLSIFREPKPRVKMLLLAAFPYTFFFYLAYSESLFTSMILGFVYFAEKMLREDNEKKANRYFLFSVICGFFMNFTRVLGVVMVFYPIFRAFQTGEKRGRAALLALGSLLSPLVFFAYCSQKFGAWDFYFQSERNIWGTYVDWSRLFPPKTLFDFRRPFHADTVSKYTTILTGIWLTWTLVNLLRAKRFLEPVFAMVLVCGMVWGEYLLGRTSWDYGGMGRYMVPVFALMLPFVPMEPKKNWKWIAIFAVLAGFEIAYALKFGRHGWVA